MTMKIILSSLITLFLFLACGRPDAVNTREDINESAEGVPIFTPEQADSSLFGTYRGVLAAEDGATLTKLRLLVDNSFILQEQCTTEPNRICEHQGQFKYDHKKKSIRYSVDNRSYHFSIEGNLLHRLDEAGKKVQSPVDQTPYLVKSDLQLGNTVWQFEKVGDSLLPKKLQREGYLRFLPDGSVAYKLSCNSCRAKWNTVVEGEIQIKPLGCTKIYCPNPYEDKLNRLLPQIQGYQIEGNTLQLSDKNTVLVTLKSPF